MEGGGEERGKERREVKSAGDGFDETRRNESKLESSCRSKEEEPLTDQILLLLLNLPTPRTTPTPTHLPSSTSSPLVDIPVLIHHLAQEIVQPLARHDHLDFVSVILCEETSGSTEGELEEGLEFDDGGVFGSFVEFGEGSVEELGDEG